MKALALFLLTGCAQLIGSDDPLLPPDANPDTPSCAAGWRTRIPIVIDNQSGRELVDYQVSVPIAATDDLRFTVGDGPLLQAAEPAGEGPLLQTRDAGVWVRVPNIPPGISEIEAFVDHPDLPAQISESPFEPDIVSNPSFEANNGWTPQPPVGPAALIIIQDDVWASQGTRALFVDHEVVGTRDYEAYSSIAQEMTFPQGSDYVLRFDLDIVAASHGGVLASSDATFIVWLGDGLTLIYKLSGTTGNINGVHLAQETGAIGPGTSPLALVTKIERGEHPGYAKAFFDHLRVRKHVSPEPTVHVGTPRPCD